MGSDDVSYPFHEGETSKVKRTGRETSIYQLYYAIYH